MFIISSVRIKSMIQPCSFDVNYMLILFLNPIKSINKKSFQNVKKKLCFFTVSRLNVNKNNALDMFC